MINRHRSNLFFLAACLAWSTAAAAAGPDADEVLRRTSAAYAGLKSYADTGVVVTEYQPPGAPAAVERHAFTTRYKSPRQFYFDFKADPKGSNERLVIWSEGSDFQTWWSATQVHEVYPKGRGTTAFLLAIHPTKMSAMQVAPMLLPQGELFGPVNGMEQAKLVAVETLGGRKHYKLTADMRTNGSRSERQPTTVWIDVENSLVSKVVEDNSEGAFVSRTTTTFAPQANPKLDEAQFRFVPRKAH